MREEALFVMLVVVLVVLPILLLIGSTILRGGVSFANKTLPKDQPRRYRYDEDDEEEEYDEGWDAYDRPKGRPKGDAVIPEPGLGKGMGIVLVAGIAQTVLGLVSGFVMEEVDREPVLAVVVGLIVLAVWFCISAGIRAGMLPTTFARACLVLLYEFLIVLAIAVCVGVPLFVLLTAMK